MKNFFWKVLVVVFFTIVFKTNFIDSFNPNHDAFQYDSEDLAIGAIAATYYDINHTWYGLGRVQDISKTQVNKNVSYRESYADRDLYASEKIYNENRKSNKNLTFQPYGSQIGLQGRLYSLISRILYSKHLIYIIRWANCFLLSCVLTSIIFLIKRKYNILMAIIWGTTFMLSPWIVNFAPNLFWVEFTWFIPLLLGLISVSDSIAMKYKKEILCIGVFLSIAIKSACGYEYLSTIIMSMLLFPVAELVEALLLKRYIKAKEIIKLIVFLSVLSLLGFALAFIIHSYYRGNGSIIEGLMNIYSEDILRRTIIGHNNKIFENSVYMESVNASVIAVLKLYFDYYKNFFNYNIILGLDGRYFNFISVLTLSLSLLRLYIDKHKRILNIKYFTIFVFSLLSTISWYILAKSHSYVHIHMNYVLWFFGYVQMCFFIIVDSILYFSKKNMSLAE